MVNGVAQLTQLGDPKTGEARESMKVKEREREGWVGGGRERARKDREEHRVVGGIERSRGRQERGEESKRKCQL